MINDPEVTGKDVVRLPNYYATEYQDVPVDRSYEYEDGAFLYPPGEYPVLDLFHEPTTDFGDDGEPSRTLFHTRVSLEEGDYWPTVRPYVSIEEVDR